MLHKPPPFISWHFKARSIGEDDGKLWEQAAQRGSLSADPTWEKCGQKWLREEPLCVRTSTEVSPPNGKGKAQKYPEDVIDGSA